MKLEAVVDRVVAAKLAEYRAKNGRNPPRRTRRKLERAVRRYLRQAFREGKLAGFDDAPDAFDIDPDE